MVSLIKARPADRGLLAVKPPSPRAASSGGYRQASGSGSGNKAAGNQDGKAKGEIGVLKPWADQPWPLIEVPSKTQHITHPALHIANEIAHIHNAMLRGLNSIYLQAPHVRESQDIADLLFLTQSWSTWLLDHHHLKENTMLPGPSAAPFHLDRDITPTATIKGKEKDGDAEDEETISFLLHRVYAYASATHKDPQAYNATTLEGLLVALADSLVPHLTRQVGVLASMRELCSGISPAATTTKRNEDIPAPLPLPMVTITRTASHTAGLSTPPSTSPPASPSSSTFSCASASTTSSSPPAHSPPSASLSLFPSTSTARPQQHKTSSSISENNKAKTSDAELSGRNLDVIDTEAKDKLARARALLEADDRANKLTQIYASAEAQAAAAIDHFVVPPMIVRLRDATATSYSAASSCFSALPSPALSRTPSSLSLSSVSSRGSRRASKGFGSAAGGVGGGNKGDWPRLSVPAVHAVADKLSPRHEGAWRFLPCDVWGRPRELPFLGS
ncbi:hypothetical protein GQX73_g8038 [Xylaria multiplex]|uniref:Hemerythrin-like domain-containing protein n=1 Tax=Xylaria multiplex TaxID=323545 RepID=A0A7C8IJZ7_9PEZI|nr:hypothetical protein GQX73_g8038 [Xylaria multiplex]